MPKLILGQASAELVFTRCRWLWRWGTSNCSSLTLHQFAQLRKSKYQKVFDSTAEPCICRRMVLFIWPTEVSFPSSGWMGIEFWVLCGLQVASAPGALPFHHRQCEKRTLWKT